MCISQCHAWKKSESTLNISKRHLMQRISYNGPRSAERTKERSVLPRDSKLLLNMDGSLACSCQLPARGAAINDETAS